MKMSYFLLSFFILTYCLSFNCYGLLPGNPQSSGAASTTIETTGNFVNGLQGPAVAGSKAVLQRTTDSVSVQVILPAPETSINHEERKKENTQHYSLWMFIINYSGSEIWDGAYRIGKYKTNGTTINMSGSISSDVEPVFGEKIAAPQESIIHIAVVPHGSTNPAHTSGKDYLPPVEPGKWWFALFE